MCLIKRDGKAGSEMVLKSPSNPPLKKGGFLRGKAYK
jgi:hypothetical protein